MLDGQYLSKYTYIKERLSPEWQLSINVKVLLYRAELICRKEQARTGQGQLQCCAVTQIWLTGWRYHGQGQGQERQQGGQHGQTREETEEEEESVQG